MGGILGSGRFQNLSWSLLALVWIPMFAFLVWGRGGVLNHMTMRREVADVATEIQTLQQDNKQLKKEIHLLETDPGTYEGAARQRLFRKKPGEIVLYLPHETGPSTGISPMGNPPQEADTYPSPNEIQGIPHSDPVPTPASNENSPAEIPLTENPISGPAIVESPSAPVPAEVASPKIPVPPEPAAAEPPPGNPDRSVSLPGDPGWLKSEPSPEADREPNTGNPLPGEPDPNGGGIQTTGGSGARRGGG